MKTKRLGNSELELTRIGFGSWAIGGGNWAFGWGPQDDNKAITAIQHAIEKGMNWIDTAAVYGLGHSEELVAKAVEGMKKKPYIFTKCSMIWDSSRTVGRSLKKDSVRRECEASLKRLKTDVIDLYQIHWPNPDEDIEEGWEEMARLKEEGLVKNIGVSNFNVQQMERVQKIAPITSLQPPYSLVSRNIENEVLPYCLKNNIGVIVYSPMGSGMLTGTMTRERVKNFPEDDWRKKAFQEPYLTKGLAIADKLKEIAAKHGKSAGEAAIAWTLRRPEVTAAIVGARNPEQVDGILAAMDFALLQEEIEELENT